MILQEPFPTLRYIHPPCSLISLSVSLRTVASSSAVSVAVVHLLRMGSLLSVLVLHDYPQRDTTFDNQFLQKLPEAFALRRSIDNHRLSLSLYSSTCSQLFLSFFFEENKSEYGDARRALNLFDR